MLDVAINVPVLTMSGFEEIVVESVIVKATDWVNYKEANERTKQAV